jgi:hypothetical protein
MTRREVLPAAIGAALACCLALPAPAAAAAAPLEIVALKARVQSQNGSTNGDFEIGGGIPVQVGERLKVSLVGTGIVNGAGREVQVDARFDVAAGHRDLSLVRTGPNWALVSINAAGGGGVLGQLGYVTTGNYRIRPGLASGRITFKIGNAAAQAAPPPVELPQGYTQDRWQQALELNARLHRAILGDEPRGDQARADAERIYRDGYGGLLTVATALARAADDRGLGRSTADRGYQERDVERVGGLYRDLLRRQASNQDLWRQDPGFRGNVEALHEKGLAAVVASIVDSPEYRSANQIGPR